MVTKVRGPFEVASGSIDIADDIEESTVEVVLRTASVSTGAADRDGHIKSADFLDVENYPEMRFVSTDIIPAGDSWAMSGDLTIKGGHQAGHSRPGVRRSDRRPLGQPQGRLHRKG